MRKMAILGALTGVAVIAGLAFVTTGASKLAESVEPPPAFRHERLDPIQQRIRDIQHQLDTTGDAKARPSQNTATQGDDT